MVFFVLFDWFVCTRLIITIQKGQSTDVTVTGNSGLFAITLTLVWQADVIRN